MYLLWVWMACLLAYLGSDKQQVLDKPFSKPLAWLGFIVFNSVACYQLIGQYAELSASLMLLTLIMMMWIVIVLSAPHIKAKGWRYCAAGSVIFALLAGLIEISLVPMGVTYVA